MSRLFFRGLQASTLVIAAAGAAFAVEDNYYVHFAALNNQPGYVTAGDLNGTPLVPPAGACGVVLEGASATDFLFYYGTEPLAIAEPEIDLGICGGGGVSIHNGDMPSGLDGAIVAEDAKLYWIDSYGKKLIYKHKCPNHCAGPGTEAGSAPGGVHFHPGILAELKWAMAGNKSIFPVATLFTLADRHLQDVSRNLGNTVAARRTFVAGELENSVRAQENDAQTRLQSAVSEVSQCRAYQARGDLKSAIVSCDSALRSLMLSKAALSAAQAWITTE
jgi:hypothetical protein